MSDTNWEDGDMEQQDGAWPEEEPTHTLRGIAVAVVFELLLLATGLVLWAWLEG